VVTLKQFIFKYKNIVIGVIIIIFGLSIYIFNQMSGDKLVENVKLPPLNETKKETKIQEVSKQTKKIIVDVKGAVKSPGVYESFVDDRVQDLIKKAGGFQEKADQKQVNLAEKVHDEMVIYIPVKGEVIGTDFNEPTRGANQENGKVDINKASLEQLQTLTGIGPAKATAIIAYRDKNGGFKKVEDLKNVTGIGDKTFEKLKDSIAVQ
jgi:competence protein ComEA